MDYHNYYKRSIQCEELVTNTHTKTNTTNA